jgi:hypothetical protein
MKLAIHPSRISSGTTRFSATLHLDRKQKLLFWYELAANAHLKSSLAQNDVFFLISSILAGKRSVHLDFLYDISP